MTNISSPSSINMRAVAALSAQIARRYRVIPVQLDGVYLKLASDSDLSPGDMDTIRASLQYSISFVPASKEKVDEVLHQYYPD